VLDTVTTIIGNIPINGTAVWEIIDGTGGVIADSSLPLTTFSGIMSHSYELTWTITTDCGSSIDTVTISFFDCSNLITDPRDSKQYSIVKIGTQCWFAQNLNIGTKINGADDPSDPSSIEKYCYDDNESNCDNYGGLYLWDEAMNYVTTEGVQGICPGGWHFPTDEEWKILEGTVDSHYGVGHPVWDDTEYRGSDVGTNLKSTTGWNDGGNGLDLYGFKALPAGRRGTTGLFNYLGDSGHFWTSTLNTSHSWDRSLYNIFSTSRRNFRSHELGFSVRCILDDK